MAPRVWNTGTQDSLIEAAQFVQVLQHRQGITIACLEEVAMRRGFITAEQALPLGDEMGKSGYAGYLRSAAIQDANVRERGGAY